MYFGTRPIYDKATLTEILELVLDIGAICLGCSWLSKLKKYGEAIKAIGTIAIGSVSFGISAFKQELAQYTISSVVSKCFENTKYEWAYNWLTVFSDFSDIVQSIIIEPNYYANILKYCINIDCYDIYIELPNEKFLINDILDFID